MGTLTPREEGLFVYLTYLDDGGRDAVKVFGGIVLDESQFLILEALIGGIAAELPLRPDRLSGFEFHASDLFVGKGPFEEIDEPTRHEALRKLIQLPAVSRATYVYSAIDMQKLRKGPMRSARWTDMAFFMCACAIDAVIREDAAAAFTKWLESDKTNTMPSARPLNVMIIDDPEQQKEDRKRIRASFRQLRGIVTQVMRPVGNQAGTWVSSHRLSTSLDDLFFGSSADSIGLQVADACNWVMWRRLMDNIKDDFYKELIAGRVVSAKPDPEWTEYRHLFKTHDASV